MAQFLDQRFRLLQILRIKPFSEPVVNLRQHNACFVMLALLLPEAREAYRCAQFPRLRLLTLSDSMAFRKHPSASRTTPLGT